MFRAAAASALLLAAGCSNQDNLIVGGANSTATTPLVLFDNIGSSISGVATLRDAFGNPTGDPMAVVIMSDRPDLCATLKLHPNYFRTPTEAFEALIMIAPYQRRGTFVIGRDDGAQAEIVAVSGPQVPTPFHALTSSYFAITTWSDEGGGSSSGSFTLFFDDPGGSQFGPQFYGKFKTNTCTTLEGTLLP